MRVAPLLSLVSSILGILTGCAPFFPSGDIGSIIRNRTAGPVTKSAISYTAYGGYGSACAYPAARFNFANGTSNAIYAALDGFVSQINRCVIAGTNDKFTISITVAMKGPLPVYLDYSIEPAGGKVCSAAGQSDSYFNSSISVKEGDHVSQGDVIAQMSAQSSSALVAVNLRADNAIICPEIFSDTILNNVGISGPLSPVTCGSASIPSATVCTQLTPSEDPSKVFWPL